MKKLLSLLSVLTISGTAMPTVIAASPYEKQEHNTENLIRNKRNIYDNNEIDVQQTLPTDRERFIFTLTPNFFEALVAEIKFSENESIVSSFFKRRIPRLSGWATEDTIVTPNICRVIIEKIDCFLTKWIESSKKNRIKFIIVEEYWRGRFEDKWVFESIEILNDNNSFENKYLNKLIEDFKNTEGNTGYYNSLTDLSIIEDNTDEYIKEKIKSYYPNLDLNQVEIIEKTNYDFFNKNFSAKIKISNVNKYQVSRFSKYSYGPLNINFIFITKKWIDQDLPKLIDSENLIQNWKSNFINWQTEINRQMNEDLPKYGNDERGKALKRTWKGNNINELNNKLLSLNHILETIDGKFKLNELYSKFQNLEKDINELKSQISKLSQKISEIQNSLNTNEDLENCANIGGLISASTGWIPVIGTLISTVSGAAAAICTIANA